MTRSSASRNANDRACSSSPQAGGGPPGLGPEELARESEGERVGDAGGADVARLGGVDHVFEVDDTCEVGDRACEKEDRACEEGDCACEGSHRAREEVDRTSE
eukprot:5457557-Pyramimonas_sp.AAC.1